jgi:ATP-dependent helicase/nuclease subunit B
MLSWPTLARADKAGRRASVLTIPASMNFAETLARGLIARLSAETNPQALAQATIYLPTRRAARGFADVFARVLGGAALLPQFRALGDVDEDEFLFDPHAEDFDAPPAITPMRRRLLLATLIRRWHVARRSGPVGFAQALALADSLAKVMDETETHGADLSRLEDLAPRSLAAHWTQVTQFLSLMRDEWPALLAAEGASNPAARRDEALRALALHLETHPPDAPVIAAGSTGSIPATAELLRVIARLPQGSVVLPGLDKALDSESWDSLDPGHPQYGMKQLLMRIAVAREDVADWDGTANNARELVLREALRPAPTTDAWRALAESGNGAVAKGLEGLSLIHASDPAEEALVIALALREALETPNRTAALVTPDRSLARRVAGELRRWDIDVDDSAGRPLAHTPPGTFLCLLAEAADSGFAPVPLLALLKHPLATMGEDVAAFRSHARALDIALRGPRPDRGLEGIARAIRNSPLSWPANAGHPVGDSSLRNGASPSALEDTSPGWPAFAGHDKKSSSDSSALQNWFEKLCSVLRPLADALAGPDSAIADILAAHVKAAEALATDAKGGTQLWRGEAGDVASQLVGSLCDAASDLPVIEAGSYASLFRTFAMEAAVRPSFGRHPRLAILGPLEARLQSFDLIVLGGLNEGTWPRAGAADPWFSRPMRERLGLEQPERAIGLSAHDFATLAAGSEVILTRSLKSEGTPSVASRWVQRLTQLTNGLGLGDALRPAEDYIALAQSLGDAGEPLRMPIPAPTPPAEARPRSLSVTDIEKWVRDPYWIYARRILNLRILDPLEAEIGPLERGNAVHKALERFVLAYPGALPADAAIRLCEIADEVFAEVGTPKAALALWRPRFLRAASWFVEEERARRADIRASLTEIEGKFEITDGFTLYGVADRIDLLADGSAAILDYKSGKPPRPKQIKAFLAPQLLLEAAMLEAGAFEAAGKLRTDALLYVWFGGGREPGAFEPVDLSLVPEAVARLKARIVKFADASMPYHPRVRPYRADAPGDYDHLSRVREWSIGGWEAADE